MKNLLVLALIVLCSIWLLWIKLNTASPTDSKKTPVAASSSINNSQPKTEREAYQALSGLIRVFESELILDNLTPITAALDKELPQLSPADRYRIYAQLEQAINAYIGQLNTEQAEIIERYAALQGQLWQQLDTAGALAIDPVASEVDQPLRNPDSETEAVAADATAEPLPQQALSPQLAQQKFDQQWPQFLKQGLGSRQQQTLDALAKQNIQVLYVGEGMYEFWLNPNYWVEHVAPHLAKADQVYFKQVAEQEQQPYAYDAGLVISWLQLGTRAHVWAQYVQDYPDAHFTELAQAKRDNYLSTLLTGMDNTPTHEQGVLLPEVKAAYAQLTQQYPNSQLSKTLSLFEQQLAEQPEDVPAAARRAIALAKDQISR